MDVAEVAHEPETELARWSADEFVELLSEGFITDRRIELLNGLMVKEMAQGPLHDFIFRALQQIFAAMGAYGRGLSASQTIVLGEGTVVEPEFVLMRPEAVGRFGLAHEKDVLWVVEVSVTSRRKDLTEKKSAYATAGIPHYWVFDAVRRGVWIFSEPESGDYAQERFVSAGETVELALFGFTLETGLVFPPLV